MSDLAIIYNQALMQYDIAMNGADLLLDNGLKTAVLLSLLLDAPAKPGDVLPSPRYTNRRGWWGNAYLPPLPNNAPDFYGSRLWLLRNAEQNQATLNRSQNYSVEALQWTVLDGVCGTLDVTCTYPAKGVINISPNFGKLGGAPKYDVLWNFN
jgi:phage gp46-like protein